MTEQELQAIEQRANGATAGPWKAEMGQVLYWSPRPTKAKPNAGYTHTLMRAEQTDYASGEFFAVVDDTDATFISHARTDVPALVAEVRRLRGALQNVCVHTGHNPSASKELLAELLASCQRIALAALGAP